MDPEFKEAMDVINGYTEEQKQQHAEDMRENYHHIIASYKRTGYDEGFAAGLAEGKSEVDRKIARTMKAQGFTVEQIAEITGLHPVAISALP